MVVPAAVGSGVGFGGASGDGGVGGRGCRVAKVGPGGVGGEWIDIWYSGRHLGQLADGHSTHWFIWQWGHHGSFN